MGVLTVVGTRYMSVDRVSTKLFGAALWPDFISRQFQMLILLLILRNILGCSHFHSFFSLLLWVKFGLKYFLLFLHQEKLRVLRIEVKYARFIFLDHVTFQNERNLGRGDRILLWNFSLSRLCVAGYGVPTFL